MSQSEQPNSLFSPRFVLTIIIVFGFWMLWQSYLAKKYPKKIDTIAQSEKIVGTPVDSVNKENVRAEPTPKMIGDLKNSDGLKTALPISEKLLSYRDGQWEFELSSNGMAVKNLKLKKYFDRSGKNIEFKPIGHQGLFAVSRIGQSNPIQFELKKNGEKEFIGIAQVDGMKITKIMQVDSEKYLLSNQVRVEGDLNEFTGLTVGFSDEVAAHKSNSFFMPRFDHQEFFISHEGENTRLNIAPDSNVLENYNFTKIAGFGSQYFALGILDKSSIKPEFVAKAESEGKGLPTMSMGLLSYKKLSQGSDFHLEFETFAGPKSYELLKSVDADMTNLINFGFFTTIAKGIFWLMKTIHGAIGNWGVAIIFLTILVRMVVLPFNMIGYKQMKAMSKIQPDMKALREKYKNDSQKLNQEMLALMKNAKANPLGGCLPMLVQIPVFFALYQVIGQSIELYQAPFVFWIHDLSLKDPYYVLPALMGLTMFIQQKITPSTLEPAQQKIMNFMPIFFTILMVSLPSGLTLYIFISSIFGVLQQFYFMRENKLETAKV